MKILFFKLTAFVAGILLALASFFRVGQQQLSALLPVNIFLSYEIALYMVCFLVGIGIAFISFSHTEKRKLAFLFSIPVMMPFLLFAMITDYSLEYNRFVVFAGRIGIAVLPIVSTLIGMYIVSLFKDGSLQTLKQDGKTFLLLLRGSILSSPAGKLLLIVALLAVFNFFGAVFLAAVFALVYLFKPTPRDVSV